MPNHIQNRVKLIASPERISEVVSLITSEGCFDFEKIIPVHQSIKDVGDSVSMSIETAVKSAFNAPLSGNPLVANLEAHNRAKNELRKEDHEQFIKACIAYKETGCAYWYDWNIKHWGTKWNAYNQPDERNTADTMYFKTAWSFPAPICEKLSLMFPDVAIEWDYADEDSGSNTGRVRVQNGIAAIDHPKRQSKEAYDLYFELHPGSEKNFEFVNGKYQYKEY